MIGRMIDKAIGVFSPGWAAKRLAARATMQQMDAFVGGNGGYQAGKQNRLTQGTGGNRTNENGLSRGQIARLRWSSWDLYRNNSHCRKLCRSLESKVIGRGMSPSPQATLSGGEPFVDFRAKVKQIWGMLASQIDYRGRPGFGGQHFADIQKTALRGVILGGEVLFYFRPLSAAEQISRETLLPIQLQLVHPERFDESINSNGGNRVIHGIELRADDTRAAYHLYKNHPGDVWQSSSLDSQRYPASSIGHLYVSEDIDQLRGVPWLSSVLLRSRDVGDYEYNELKAAAMAACVVLGYRRSSAQSQFGPNAPSDWDLTDGDGNRITNLSPGMLLDLGSTGEIQGFNPQRPNAGAAEFLSYELRSIACGVPGTKGSTVTGDYRNSSFSSERSADNDAWPEIEGIQDWFAFNFMQPIFERVIEAAVIEGKFDDVAGFSAEDYLERKADYLSCQWQGPVSRSINPTDDADAARKRVQNGASSPQIEAAILGRDWRDILRDLSEFKEYAAQIGISEDISSQILGIDQADQQEAAPVNQESPPATEAAA